MRAATLAALALALAGCGGGAHDVVVVTLDTVRADRLGCYGSGRGLTPRLDAFARGATVFDDASCAVPLTLPSHATLFTGRYPSATGVRNNGAFVVPEEETTLAEALAARGFHTGAVVAAFPLQRRYGLAQGFEVYDDDLPPAPLEPGAAFSVHFAERRAGVVTDRALQLWSRLRGPRFLWVHYFDAHAPYAPPEPFATAHAGAPYDGEIAYLDREVGRLLDRVARDDPDAIVVVAADHGEGLGDHGEKTHGVFLYQSTVHVPLIVRAPGHWKAGKHIGAPVSLADVLPTVLAMVGAPPPPGLDGTDLAPLVVGSALRPRDVYAESYLPFLQFRFAPLTMLRSGTLKVIDAPAPELYDVAADPSETSNAWGRDPAGSALAQKLAERVAHADPEADRRAAGGWDEEAEARLRSLGYASAGTMTGTHHDARDPKTMTAYLERYDRAVGLVASGRIDDGLAILRALVPEAPENFMARYQIAAALLAAGRQDEAAAELQEVVRVAPELGAAHLMLADCLTATGKLDAALRAFEEAARRMPGQAEPKIAEGRALEARGRFDAAGAAYLDAIEREPGSADAARSLVALLMGRGEADRAVRELHETSSRHPGSAAVWTAYADVLARTGDAPGARLAVARALALDPGRPEASLLQATLLLDAGKAKDAIAIYRSVLALRPELTPAEWGLARALVLGGDDAEAAAAVAAITAKYPGRAQGQALRGLLFERRGDREAAADAYRAALALDPGNVPARKGLERIAVRR